MQFRVGLLLFLLGGAIAQLVCPDVPDTPDACNVCGPGACVTAPDEIFVVPGQPAAACGVLQQAGFDGLIPIASCPALPGVIGISCKCMPGGSPPGAPVAPPVDGPIAQPLVCPDVPDTPDACNVCGLGACVTAPDEIFVFVAQPAVPCGVLQDAGLNGVIPIEFCAAVAREIGICKCMPEGSPVAPPVDPVAPPVEGSPVAPPSPRPIPAPPPATPNPPTDYPVFPPSSGAPFSGKKMSGKKNKSGKERRTL